MYFRVTSWLKIKRKKPFVLFTALKMPSWLKPGFLFFLCVTSRRSLEGDKSAWEGDSRAVGMKSGPRGKMVPDPWERGQEPVGKGRE